MKMIVLCVAGLALAAPLCRAQTALNPAMTLVKMNEAKQKDWLTRWDKEITGEATGYRTCDRAVGEDIAWVVSPVLDGFYWGYMATGNTKYVEMLVDWTDSMIKRAVKEPDGYVGWPSFKAAGTDIDNLDNTYDADSMLSDAMAFRPIVLMAGRMTKDPMLKAKYGAKGESYLKLAEQIYEKWATRGGWRETSNGGMISLVLPYGLDKTRTKWVDFDTRNAPGHGFSHPDNKATEVALWMLAMWDATGKPEYKERAEKWFKLLKSRMKANDDTYEIWNYWEPAGPWDYKPDGSTKHWVGVHPRGGYYEMDVSGAVAACEHGLVFTKADIERLINTAKTSWRSGDPGDVAAGMEISVEPPRETAREMNACFRNSKTSEPTSAGPRALAGTVVRSEWNKRTNAGTTVVRPTGGKTNVTLRTNRNTRVQVLRMWSALAPYDVEIQKQFEATEDPTDWGALGSVPHWLVLQNELARR
jgi:hypothetical protein